MMDSPNIQPYPSRIPPPPTTPPQGLCIICNLSDPKYKCPGCLKATCSLQCSKHHKTKFNCKGIRDKTRPIPMKSYDLPQLRRDFNYLTEVQRSWEGIRRRQKVEIQIRGIGKRYKTLRYFCKHKRGIYIKFAPNILTTHITNMSYINNKENSIYWTLQFKFLLPNNTHITYCLEKPRSEKLRIIEVFMEFADKTKFYTLPLNMFLSQFTEEDFREATLFIKNRELSASEIRNMGDNTNTNNRIIEGKLDIGNDDDDGLKNKTQSCWINKILNIFNTFEEELKDCVIHEFPTIIVCFKSVGIDIDSV